MVFVKHWLLFVTLMTDGIFLPRCVTCVGRTLSSTRYWPFWHTEGLAITPPPTTRITHQFFQGYPMPLLTYLIFQTIIARRRCRCRRGIKWFVHVNICKCPLNDLRVLKDARSSTRRKQTLLLQWVGDILMFLRDFFPRMPSEMHPKAYTRKLWPVAFQNTTY